MNEDIVIPRRVLSSLMNSISSGVISRVGAPYLAIGRNREIAALSSDLENTAEGGSFIRFLVGKYGSGKSFLIELTRHLALERNFITADCDLSPNRRLYGTGGRGLATARELVKNLATKASPEGNALPAIISGRISAISALLAREGIAPGTAEFERRLEKGIFTDTDGIESMVGGFDFITVVNEYCKARLHDDGEKAAAAMKWLRCEYDTKSEAKKYLPVTGIINDENWFDYIKLLARFSVSVGYSGFIVFLDECVNLYKIPNKISREANYEKLLSIFNDSVNGRSPYLGVICAGTPQFLEDERRGLYSYEALHSRLGDSRFENDALRSFSGPVLRLRKMGDDELYALILRVGALFEKYNNIPLPLSEEDNRKFLAVCLERVGANSLITPREIIRDYLSVLNILKENPEMTFDKLLSENAITLKTDVEDDPDTDIGNFEF